MVPARRYRLIVASACAVFSSCGRSPFPPSGSADGGAPHEGRGPHLAIEGGSLDALVFAVVGDTRPRHIDDDQGYPRAVIEGIYRDLAELTPQPAFAVTTGDYQYATPGSASASVQVGLYAQAQRLFQGPVFAAMGNHECNGWTSSNCGPEGRDGEPTNYREFLRQLLGPVHQTRPYYAIPIAAADRSWTAKVVVIAANAWDQGQAQWLEQALSEPTTYTFAVRHENSASTTAPGVIPSDAILERHPLTLLLVGHRHTFRHDGPNYRELIVGNGGAPEEDDVPYGFALIARRPDGDLTIRQFNWTTAQPEGIAFAITPEGHPAPL
jgi:Calcineurin-like phosphoesterase